MRGKGKYIILAGFAVGILLAEKAFSQSWGGEADKSIWSYWTVNLNAGLTSFFGDISIYDSEIDQKLFRESNTAVGIIVTKNLFGNSLKISGQLFKGNLKGQKSLLSFRTGIIEYNLQLRADVVDLIRKPKPHKLGIDFYGGIGQFFFKANKFVPMEGYTENIVLNSGVPEFVFFFGGAIHYKLNEKLSLTADLSLHQCRDDRLDDYVKGGNFDYFSYLNAGISYHIKSLRKNPLRNKARIANSSFLFSL